MEEKYKKLSCISCGSSFVLQSYKMMLHVFKISSISNPFQTALQAPSEIEIWLAQPLWWELPKEWPYYSGFSGAQCPASGGTQVRAGGLLAPVREARAWSSMPGCPCPAWYRRRGSEVPHVGKAAPVTAPAPYVLCCLFAFQSKHPTWEALIISSVAPSIVNPSL